MFSAPSLDKAFSLFNTAPNFGISLATAQSRDFAFVISAKFKSPPVDEQSIRYFKPSSLCPGKL
jgi:hypothetical protein